MELNEILKSNGALGAKDVALGGNLNPSQGRTFINAIVNKEGLFSLITVDKSSSLAKQRTAFDIGREVLKRHKSGVALSDKDLSKIGQVGCTLDMSRGLSLNARILDETLNDNKDNPHFEAESFESFSATFSNDLVRLGFVGTADSDSASADFKQLAKGWIQIAKDESGCVKVSGSYKSISDTLKDLVAHMHDDIRGSKAVIFLSNADYDAYQLEVAKIHPTSGALINGGIDKFMGYKLIPNENIASGTFLATLPKNMVFGIANQIERRRWYDNETSSLRYKFVVYPDYQFDIYKYVTLLEVSGSVGAG